MIALVAVLSLATAAEPLAGGDRVVEGEFRVAGGGAAVRGVDGVAPTLEVGVDMFPASRLGLRLGAGAAVKVGWGGFYAAPELVLRPLGREHAVTPFVTAGVQVGVYNFTDEALGRDVAPMPMFQPAAGGTQTEAPDGAPGGGGTTPLAFAWGPRATAGVTLRLSDRAAIDLGVRYAPFAWRGDWYHGVGVLLAVAGSLH